MATLIQAVQRYGPKLEYSNTVGMEKLAEWVARSSGLNINAVRMTLGELSDAILFFASLGAPVSLPGIGRFRATLARDGRLRVRVSTSRRLIDGVNGAEGYEGGVINPERIGWTNEQFKERWDEEHPDDPLILPAGPDDIEEIAAD